MKVCVKCKTVAQDNMSFCAQCGGGVFEAVKMSTGAKVVSVFISIFLVLALVVGGLLLTVKTALSGATVDNVIQTMTDDLADMEIGQLVDADEEDVTIAEYIHSVLPSEQRADVSVKDIEALLEEEFVVEFIEDTAQNYLSDAVYDNGDGELELDAILELIEENQDVITEHTGYYLHEEDMMYIEDMLESADLEQYELEAIAEENGTYFGLLRLANSTALLVVTGIVVLLLIALIFIVCRNARYSFKCMSIDMIIAGGFLGIVAALVPVLGNAVKSILDVGVDVTGKLFGTMTSCSLIETAALVGGGSVILVVLLIVKKLSARRTA